MTVLPAGRAGSWAGRVLRATRRRARRELVITTEQVVVVTDGRTVDLSTIPAGTAQAEAPSPWRQSQPSTFYICPCCLHGDFEYKTYGQSRRPNAQCPTCGSLERHRLLWLCMHRRYGGVAADTRILHIAPERVMESLLRGRSGPGYVSMDIGEGRADVVGDITDMVDFEASRFDVVVCSHVLEHVPDDRAALREVFRVLSPSGVAFLMVPQHNMSATLEDLSITDPEERRRRFGQPDHVRRYGHDFVERVREAGFEVQEHAVGDILTPEEAETFRCDRYAGSIFAATKPSP